MATYKKTWKIGEYAKGGIITIEITGNTISVISKEWDYSQGTRRSSDQSNAEELSRTDIGLNESEAYRKLYGTLVDLTTSYYAEQIIEWIKTKVKSKLKESILW